MNRRKKTPEMLAAAKETNEARIKNGFQIYASQDYINGEWDEGYCMSIGCSCNTEDALNCHLFRRFDSDRIKKDFVYQSLGWGTSSSEPDRCEYLKE